MATDGDAAGGSTGEEMEAFRETKHRVCWCSVD